MRTPAYRRRIVTCPEKGKIIHRRISSLVKITAPGDGIAVHGGAAFIGSPGSTSLTGCHQPACASITAHTAGDDEHRVGLGGRRHGDGG
jgi:hypothetical protein